VLNDWPRREKHTLHVTLWEEHLDAALGGELAEFAAATAHIGGDELATIMYTSGTTGRPRGVMLSHGNLASNAATTAAQYPTSPEDLRLCFLPLSHIYARTCDLYAWLARGTRMALARSRETIIEDCGLVQPTMINGVPYFYEKIYRRLHEAGVADQEGMVQKLLGGRVKYCFCGGAALPAHVETYFASQGTPILPGYGLSETSPVISLSTHEAYRSGSVGRVLPGIEVRIAGDGEIVTRGPHVMQGYWKDPATTSETIRDGWLHTGDLGRLDDDGFLTITGRKKEILVTSLGKNVEPTAIERRLALPHSSRRPWW
jgi:long-chain acyl-CoA synthetase